MTTNHHRTAVHRFTDVALLALFAIACSARAKADPITFSSGAVAPLWLSPADDNVSLSGVGSTSSSDSRVTFQSGSFYVGNSPIADQNILFSFVTAVTIDGNTQNVTILGEDEVTSAADTLLIFAGAPVYFGDLKFTLDASSTIGTSVNTTLPIALTADITQTPEPAELVLLGTGVLGFACGAPGRRFERLREAWHSGCVGRVRESMDAAGDALSREPSIVRAFQHE